MAACFSLPSGYARKTDGTPAVRLGDGTPQGLSTDGKWVLMLRGHSNGPNELVMMPIGPGTERKIPIEGLDPQEAWPLPDGKGFVARGLDGKDGKPPLAVFGPDGGKPTPVRAEGYFTDKRLIVSPGGERMAYLTKDGRLEIVPLSGGETTTVPGGSLDRDTDLVQWSSDDRWLYVVRGGGKVPAQIDRIEVATGRSESWKKLMPTDSAGVWMIANVRISRDGQSYAYSCFRNLVSDLWIMDGVR